MKPLKSNIAKIRVYEELNDFLPPDKRKKEFDYQFANNPSIKDVIEAIGIPHPEVELIIINGISHNFNYQLQKGDYVSLYPVFESLDISPLIKLRDKPLRASKFILDVHLGKLAKYLRLLGFDVAYDNQYEDQEIIRRSLSEQRIILTRDKGLLKNKVVTHGYWLRHTVLKQQLIEIIKRFDLLSQIKIFHRCLVCNGILEQVDKNEIIDQLLPATKKYYTDFYRCNTCFKIYWQGSHYKRMQSFVQELIDYLPVEGRDE